MKMKNLFFLALFITAAFINFTSCEKDKKDDGLIEGNGLSRDINDFISQEILDILDSLDMPINTGGNPPSLEGTFLKSPNILLNSNRSSDIIGKSYSDLYVTYSNQDTDNLTVTVKQKQNSKEGDGIGSYIVGNDNSFSVFSKLLSYDSENNDSALLAKIYSGTISEEGIINYHDCLVMVDDFGDPNDQYISIGDTRVFHDSDSIAKRVIETKSVSIAEKTNLNLLNECSDRE